MVHEQRLLEIRAVKNVTAKRRSVGGEADVRRESAPCIALGRRAASEAIGLGPHSDWLLDPDCPIPKCDIRKPGAKQPVYVWLWDDLRAFVESRRVQPGFPNPQDR